MGSSGSTAKSKVKGSDSSPARSRTYGRTCSESSEPSSGVRIRVYIPACFSSRGRPACWIYPDLLPALAVPFLRPLPRMYHIYEGPTATVRPPIDRQVRPRKTGFRFLRGLAEPLRLRFASVRCDAGFYNTGYGGGDPGQQHWSDCKAAIAAVTLTIISG